MFLKEASYTTKAAFIWS